MFFCHGACNVQSALNYLLYHGKYHAKKIRLLYWFLFACHFFKGCAPVIYLPRSIHPHQSTMITRRPENTGTPDQEKPWEICCGFLGAEIKITGL